ncbi:MAG: phosphoenolpyruvate--protein phosphotransferase [Solirubrobacteraceae bacterium]
MGIVVVSHSQVLAEGVVALAREMGGAELAIEAAGGLDEPGVLGTDAERVRAAIERAMSDDGVLVLMDLGSALMSAEFAIEMLAVKSDRVRLSDAPLVEGAVAAAAAASGGATLEEVAVEARGAMKMKVSQLETDVGGVATEASGGAPPPDDRSPASAVAQVKLPVGNAEGLHARPAARFIELARSFDAAVTVAKIPGDPVGATSLTNVIALGARPGDTLLVSASGPQARQAVEALEALGREGFGDGISALLPPLLPARSDALTHGDDARSSSGEGAGVMAVTVPAPGDVLRGIGAASGIALGPARRLGGAGALEAPAQRPSESPARERERLEEGIAGAQAAIERDRGKIAARAGRAEAEIFDAHLLLLSDDAMLDPAEQAITAGANAECAWYEAAQQVAVVYRSLDEPLLRERAADVLDVGRRVLTALQSKPGDAISQPGIVIAAELTPADAAALEPKLVTGIATAHGAATAHAAILARALGLPAVVGLGEAVLEIREGATLLLDGDEGTLVLEPSEAISREAQERAERRAASRTAVRRRAHEPGATRDGARVEVFANLGSPGEAARAVSLGAEGVGLLRTEFLYLDRAELPDEDEQVSTLREIASALEGRPLVIRTLDAGADKPLSALPMPAETNPFLGVRGIRLSLARPDVLAAQFRAILRVAADFPVKVMLPMVATLEEITQARALLDQARLQTGVDAALELGIMVEVPAAALSAARLAEEADFFSLGTNDLTQYTMAAERGDERLATLLSGLQPAVLRLVHATVQAAASQKRRVGVCGELAGDPAAAILLVGLGVTELSMAPVLIPEIKATLRAITLGDAQAAGRAALDARDPEEARALATRLLMSMTASASVGSTLRAGQR